MTLALVFGLAALLIWGVAEVFRLRFQAGDIYPEYSTLRADPLGAKAAYDTIEELGDRVQVSRQQQDLRLLEVEANSTLFFAGVTGHWLDDVLTRAEFDVIDTAIQAGARCVITFSGRDNAIGGDIEREEEAGAFVTPDDVLDREAEKSVKNTGGQKVEKENDEEVVDSDESPILGIGAIKRRWGFGVGYATSEDWDLQGGVAADVEIQSTLLRESIAIRSPWRFTKLAPEWQPVATVGGRPVIMQRPYGEGELVLCADSWFLSNESLAKRRELGELLWTVGDRPILVFDEAHHGVQESEGVVGMATRYQLHGVIPGLVILFLLVLWRGSASLVPGAALLRTGSQGATVVDGIDAESGVVRLMRTGISKQEILRQCYLAWARNPVLRRRFSKAEVESVRDRVVAEESKSSSERNLVEAYTEITSKLSRRSS
ncbi:MAG: DUF4350 domain-containing protein [Verrucomicrobiales bacterium]